MASDKLLDGRCSEKHAPPPWVAVVLCGQVEPRVYPLVESDPR